MFLDYLELFVQAGKGGDGVVAWRREKYIPKGGPAGGNGGKGGSIYIKASHKVASLEGFQLNPFIKAEDGNAGGRNRIQGRQGKDSIIEMPIGTVVKAIKGDQEILLGDLVEDGQTLLLCKGGRGGIGNYFFRSATNQAPTKCTLGKVGESEKLILELKLIADVGFVGLPNAGKSTLLGSLTSARVKIGDYPFTTLTPNISTAYFPDYSTMVLADLPGLIEGAHQNRGLGVQFLRHVDRSALLVFVIDLSGDDPQKDLTILREELFAYNPSLLDKPQLLVLNKNDVDTAEENFAQWLDSETLPPDSHWIRVSALTGEGCDELLRRLQKLKKVLPTAPQAKAIDSFF